MNRDDEKKQIGDSWMK